jgi:hypothetical protein
LEVKKEKRQGEQRTIAWFIPALVLATIFASGTTLTNTSSVGFMRSTYTAGSGFSLVNQSATLKKMCVAGVSREVRKVSRRAASPRGSQWKWRLEIPPSERG